MSDWGLLISIIVKVAKILRFLGFTNIVSAVKKRASLDLTTVLHQEVIHKIRTLSPSLQSQDWHCSASIAIQFCSACRELMGNLTELTGDEIHCCLKVFRSGKCTDKEDAVVTLARSLPFDNRPLDQNVIYTVRDNTVWCALFGEHDGHTKWPRFKCFACNDLQKHQSVFHCTRDRWYDHYRSTLVFPINYMRDTNTLTCEISGFLAFDSPIKNAFSGLPDIFDFREKPAQYYKQLRKSAIFQVGAAISDTLGIAFVPYCDIIG